MPKRQVFYSFHYGKDCRRVQQIRNMGVFEGNEPVSASAWEDVQREGNVAVERWIDDNMKYRSCVVVLIGEDTANRPWVKYEIKKAYELGKKIIGIYIRNLKDPIFGKCSKGKNPFDQFKVSDGSLLSKHIKCYDPNSRDAYNDIKQNMNRWIEQA